MVRVDKSNLYETTLSFKNLILKFNAASLDGKTRILPLRLFMKIPSPLIISDKAVLFIGLTKIQYSGDVSIVMPPL